MNRKLGVLAVVGINQKVCGHDLIYATYDGVFYPVIGRNCFCIIKYQGKLFSDINDGLRPVQHQKNGKLKIRQ